VCDKYDNLVCSGGYRRLAAVVPFFNALRLVGTHRRVHRVSVRGLAWIQLDRPLRPLPQPLPTTLLDSGQFAAKPSVPATLRGGGHVALFERVGH
jgi:hypothetical protein